MANQAVGTTSARLDKQKKTEFWITGLLETTYENFWYRVELGEVDFGLEVGGLTLDEPVLVHRRTLPGEFVTLDDRFIYCAGGNSVKPTNHIYCLDTTNSEKGWKIMDTVMKMDRQYPTVAALEGKIYIFGGVPTADSLSQSEVYDPVTGVIQELQVDEHKYNYYLVGVDEVFKRIIFCSYVVANTMSSSREEVDYLYFYNPKEQTWSKEIIKDADDRFQLADLMNSPHVVVGTTIYWVTMDRCMVIKAYDFVNKSFSFSGVFELFTKEENPGWTDEDSCVSSMLLHMDGGENCFCIFWDPEEYSSEGKEIRCTGLKISNSDTSLSVSVLGTRTYTISGADRAFIVRNILPIPKIENKGLKIEWSLVAGAVALFTIYLRHTDNEVVKNILQHLH